MKTLLYFSLLLLIPIYGFADNNTRHIEGAWYDDYSGYVLQIKDDRKGIKVRVISEWGDRSGWDRYYRMGRGVYDNCDGRVVVVRGRNRIEWRSRRRSIVFSKDRRYREDWTDYRRENRYNYSHGRTRDYCGDWYCADQRLYLQIEAHGTGFRARRPQGGWTYYESARRGGDYRDRNGNRYFFDNNNRLCWESSDGRRRFSFAKR